MSIHNKLNNAHFDFITEVHIGHNNKHIPFRCWSEQSKIHVKLHLNGGRTMTANMNLDYASLFIQRAIPAIMQSQADLINDYINNTNTI